MRASDYDEFRMVIRVLGVSYDTFIGDEHVSYYWSVLETEPFAVVAEICNTLTRMEHHDAAKIPSAHQIRRLVRQEQFIQSSALACQAKGCPELVPWPPKEAGEGTYYCPRHQPEHDRPATPQEKRAILMRATPKARAFLRGIREVARYMTEIPITPEEQAATEALDRSIRPKAFEETASGPGVNPGLFLNGTVTEDAGWLDGYRKGAEIMAVAGFRYDMDQAVWTRGRQQLTDDQVGRMDEEVLRLFVGRR